MRVLGALMFGLGACGSEMPPLPAAPPTIFFVPVDGTTGADTKEIGANVVEVFAGQVSSAQLEMVGAGLSLRTWPELATVETSALAPDAGLELRLAPVNALTERWYAVRLDAVPSGLQLGPMGTQRRLPDGAYTALFFNGSAPGLRRIFVYDVKGGAMPIELDFSEPVAEPETTVTQSGQTFRCALDGSGLRATWSGTCAGPDPAMVFVVETTSPASSTSVDRNTFGYCGPSCWYENVPFTP
jgi:hypothetical protein